jgi:acetylornithine deacetylase/succinyl-diaminopimelate desuccinylase-like protein
MNAPRTRTRRRLDAAAARQIDAQWDGDIVRQLTDYIAIPAKSPAFDPTGRSTASSTPWCATPPVGGGAEGAGPDAGGGAPAGRTPVIFFEIAGTKAGHADRADVRPPGQAARVQRLARRPGPLDAQVEDGKLYGRGGADDGYAVYASIAAVQA